MTRRRAPTYTRAQVMALAGAQAITAEAQARGDALMRGESDANQVHEARGREGLCPQEDWTTKDSNGAAERSRMALQKAPAKAVSTAVLHAVPQAFSEFLTAAAAASPEIAKAARAGKARTTTTGASEAQVLSAVLAFLRLHPGVARVWRQNTGAMEGAGGQFVRFGFEGQPDICGFMKDGRALYVEVKREKGGRVSEAQAEFIEAARAAGCVAGVARSVDEARAIVEARA